MSHLVVILFAFVFACVHSGMAALRPTLEKKIPPRLYRVLFVVASFAVATPWLLFLVEHRYDGIRLFNFQHSVLLHGLVFLMASFAFFFLYPGAFRFSEIVTINKPTQRFYTEGIIRITRHPQLTGMTLWCLSHFLWIGTTFSLATSFGLIAYHLFAAWHGDKRRLKLFGDKYRQLMNTTSIIPFKAIIEGKQKLQLGEFVDKAYFWIVVFISTVYYFHPNIKQFYFPWNNQLGL